MNLRTALVLVVLATPAAARAAEVTAVTAAKPAPEANPLFPGAGHFVGSLATGVPYVAIGEAAYGFCDSFALGAIGGLTPTTWGAGLRARAKLYDSKSNRVYAAVPALYYPATEGLGDAPWLLAMPSVMAEHRFGVHLRLHLGAGIAAATVLARSEQPRDDADFAAWSRGGEAGYDAPTQGLWETVTVGAVVPVSAHVSLFADASAVLHGVSIASDWIGGPPAVVTLGAARSF